MLALANGPVGPADYTTKLTELRGEIGAGPTFVLADPELLEERHGTEFIAWELRGGRVCIAPTSRAGGPPPRGVRYVIAPESLGPEPPFRGLADVAPGRAVASLAAPRPPALAERLPADRRSPGAGGGAARIDRGSGRRG